MYTNILIWEANNNSDVIEYQVPFKISELDVWSLRAILAELYLNTKIGYVMELQQYNDAGKVTKKDCITGPKMSWFKKAKENWAFRKNTRENPMTAFTVIMFISDSGEIGSQRVERFVGALEAVEIIEAYYEKQGDHLIAYVLDFNSENIMLTTRKFTYPQKGLL